MIRPNNPQDNELLYRLCKERDMNAWEQVYQMVYGVASWKKWNLSHAVAEDISQDVVEKLIKSGLEGIRKKRSFSSFLKRATVNKIIDHFRRLKRERQVSLDKNEKNNKGKNLYDLISSKLKNPEKATVEKDLLKRVLKIIKAMKPPCCEVLPIYFHHKAVYNKTKIKDIARFFNRPEGTVSVWISRCLKVLFKHPVMKDIAKSV